MPPSHCAITKSMNVSARLAAGGRAREWQPTTAPLAELPQAPSNFFTRCSTQTPKSYLHHPAYSFLPITPQTPSKPLHASFCFPEKPLPSLRHPRHSLLNLLLIKPLTPSFLSAPSYPLNSLQFAFIPFFDLVQLTLSLLYHSTPSSSARPWLLPPFQKASMANVVELLS